MNRQQYNISIQTYQVGGYVNSFCASILFSNTGTQNVMLMNSFLLIPGATLRIEANEGEEDVTRYIFSFIGSGAPSLTVFIKNYVDSK